MIGADRIRLRSPHSRWLGDIDRSNAPYWNTAAANSPVMPWRSRSASNVAAVRWPPAESPPIAIGPPAPIASRPSSPSSHSAAASQSSGPAG